jgi:hypothetical protein
LFLITALTAFAGGFWQLVSEASFVFPFAAGVDRLATKRQVIPVPFAVFNNVVNVGIEMMNKSRISLYDVIHWFVPPSALSTVSTQSTASCRSSVSNSLTFSKYTIHLPAN